MMWTVENWAIFVAAFCIIIGIYHAVCKYLVLPKEYQIKAIKQWLLYAVSEAEKNLGGGTGKLKLRMVYDAFVTKFPTVARVITFEQFSVWVDEALIDMKRILEDNVQIRQYVIGSKF